MAEQLWVYAVGHFSVFPSQNAGPTFAWRNRYHARNLPWSVDGLS